MDLSSVRDAAAAALPADAWAFYQGTADGAADPERDARAWERWELIPRVLTGLTTIDTSVVLGGRRFSSPVVVAATAAQGGCQQDGELLTVAAAGAAGVLMTYSHNASVPVAAFGAAASSPWWAQIYLQRDATATDEYLDRCGEAGAEALVLTVDVPGDLAEAPFRLQPLSGAVALRGNVAPTGGGAGGRARSDIGPADITRMADRTGLPVWVKGVMTAADAERALDAGAAGVIVSNHGRRQLDGVAPVASVLVDVVDGVGGRAPVLVDGGIRSGTAVVKALALGATAVGVGRPVLWSLAVGGQAAVEELLRGLRDEVAVALAGLGAPSIAALSRGMVRPAW